MLKYCLIPLLLFSAPCLAQGVEKPPVEIAENLKSASLVGQGRLTLFTWEIYDAHLYAPKGKYILGKPLGLTLVYLRSITGKEIADKSIEEIRNQGFKDEEVLAEWHKQMLDIFPDVVAKTRLSGIYTADGKTMLFKDGIKIGGFDNPELSRYFFDIWLGTKTSQPILREQLLGH